MEKMNWNAASVRMAAASIVSALVAAGVVWMWTGVYLPGAGLSISLLLVLLAGLLAGGRSPRGMREWLLVAACVLEDLTFFFFMSTSLRLVNLPVAAGLTALTLFSLNGRLNHGAAEAGALGETLRILPRACVRYIPVPFRALPRARLSTGIVVGLIISVPVLAVAMLLLCSADAVFEGMFTGLLNRLYEADVWALLVKPLLFLLLGLIAFSFLYAQKALERLPEREAKPPFPTGALATPMLLLCALYALFAAVQFIYLFGGREAAAMRGGYAQYARNGFFELVVICALNLLLAGLAVRRSGGARVVRAAAVGMYGGDAGLVGVAHVAVHGALRAVVPAVDHVLGHFRHGGGHARGGVACGSPRNAHVERGLRRDRGELAAVRLREPGGRHRRLQRAPRGREGGRGVSVRPVARRARGAEAAGEGKRVGGRGCQPHRGWLSRHFRL